MPNDMALSASAPSASQHADLALADDVHDGGSGKTGSAPASAAGTIANSGTLVANPTMKLSPDLGIVVIEFHNARGDIINQIPSQRALEAYLSGAAKLPHEGGAGAAAPASGDAV